MFIVFVFVCVFFFLLHICVFVCARAHTRTLQLYQSSRGRTESETQCDLTMRLLTEAQVEQVLSPSGPVHRKLTLLVTHTHIYTVCSHFSPLSANMYAQRGPAAHADLQTCTREKLALRLYLDTEGEFFLLAGVWCAWCMDFPLV